MEIAGQKIVHLQLSCVVSDASVYRDAFHDFHVHISDELVRSKDDTDFVGLFERIRQMCGVLSLSLTPANEVNN